MERKVYEFISTKTNDPIVERKVCTVSGQDFPIYQSDLEFYDKISPVFNGVKYSIPTPTLCPEERMIRRLSFRNERRLYKRACDATGRQIISMYNEESKHRVYDQKHWWSDARDPLIYGVDFDFSKNFSNQFLELLIQVPSFNLINIEPTNSEYCNHALKLTNCYMCFSALESTNCINSRGVVQSNKCIDCVFIEKSELCYECVKCNGCYKLFHSNECTQCTNSSYLTSCIQCEYCFNCNNLQNKKYCINNIQYNKEDYEKLIKTEQRTLSIIKKGQNQISCHDSYGNNLIGCNHCSFTSELSDSEYTKYTYDDSGQKNCYDCYGGSASEYCLEIMSCANSYNTLFTCYGNNNTNILYCNKTYNCKDCFGCVGIRNKQYCIFNKQYDKEKYETLVPKIIEHMQRTNERGEFFNPKISPFGYNETVAQDYYSMTKKETITKGYTRSDYDSPIPTVDGMIQAKDLQNIPTTDDSILTKAVVCEISGKPFRIIKSELDFYRENDLSLPTKHPDIRHQERIKSRPSKELFIRACDNCNIQILSAYPQGYQHKVCCESCYNKEVYG